MGVDQAQPLSPQRVCLDEDRDLLVGRRRDDGESS